MYGLEYELLQATLSNGIEASFSDLGDSSLSPAATPFPGLMLGIDLRTSLLSYCRPLETLHLLHHFLKLPTPVFTLLRVPTAD